VREIVRANVHRHVSRKHASRVPSPLSGCVCIFPPVCALYVSTYVWCGADGCVCVCGVRVRIVRTCAHVRERESAHVSVCARARALFNDDDDDDDDDDDNNNSYNYNYNYNDNVYNKCTSIRACARV
jgi:hypothetical protein